MSQTLKVEKRYFLVFEGQELGPFERSEVDKFLKNSSVTALSKVRLEDSKQWMTARQLFPERFEQEAVRRAPEITSDPLETEKIESNPQIPRDVMSWSWAAFLWGPFWAVYHRVWWGLSVLVLFPILDLLPILFLGLALATAQGIYGRRLAWKRGHWRSVDQMNKNSNSWVSAWCLVMGTLSLCAALAFSAVSKLSWP